MYIVFLNLEIRELQEPFCKYFIFNLLYGNFTFMSEVGNSKVILYKKRVDLLNNFIQIGIFFADTKEEVCNKLIQ